MEEATQRKKTAEKEQETQVPLGVHIDVLCDLHDKARDVGATTTEEVCEKVVKPATMGCQCTFVDTLRGQTSLTDGRSLVGPATVFVSHAWRYDLSIPLDVMLEHTETHPEAYFWFDLVSRNQHVVADRPFDWWYTTFRDGIASIGRMILVLSPWEDPVPLTRAWCLWEIYSASTIPSVRLEVRLPRPQRSGFRAGLVKDMEATMGTLVRVQAERAEASIQQDRDNIFTAIEQTCGFGQLNDKIKDQLRVWLLEVALEAAEEHDVAGTKDEETARLFHNVAVTLTDIGDYTKALEFYNKDLTITRTTLGDKHPDTAATYHNMANVHYQQGGLSKALEFYNKALAIYVATLGDKHSNTARTYNNMAIVYEEQGDYAEALECYHKALIIQLGNKHSNTARTYKYMANVCNKQGNHAKALEYYNKALTIQLGTLGDKHSNTARIYHNIAGIYYQQGDYTKALECYHKALIIQLGNKHPNTAMTYNNMANIYEEQGDYTEALEYYHKALTIQLATLGDKHSNTASIYYNIAGVYYQQGNYTKALEFFNKTLTIQLGNKHPNTAMTYKYMANVYEEQGDYATALEYYRKAHAVILEVFGPDHPTTCQYAWGVRDAEAKL